MEGDEGEWHNEINETPRFERVNKVIEVRPLLSSLIPGHANAMRDNYSEYFEDRVEIIEHFPFLFFDGTFITASLRFRFRFWRGKEEEPNHHRGPEVVTN
jgi:hypothetical protein